LKIENNDKMKNENVAICDLSIVVITEEGTLVINKRLADRFSGGKAGRMF